MEPQLGFPSSALSRGGSCHRPCSACAPAATRRAAHFHTSVRLLMLLSLHRRAFCLENSFSALKMQFDVPCLGCTLPRQPVPLLPAPGSHSARLLSFYRMHPLQCSFVVLPRLGAPPKSLLCLGRHHRPRAESRARFPAHRWSCNSSFCLLPLATT